MFPKRACGPLFFLTAQGNPLILNVENNSGSSALRGLRFTEGKAMIVVLRPGTPEREKASNSIGAAVW